MDNVFYQRTNKKLFESSLGADTVLLDEATGCYYSMNLVSSSIWKLLSSRQSAESIMKSLLEEYDVPEETCKSETERILAEFTVQGLIEQIAL